MIIRILIFIITSLFFANGIFAQNNDKVHWVEKAKNPSFFEKGKALPTLLINAVRFRKIKPYQVPQNQQTTQEMSVQYFEQNMKIPQSKGGLITDNAEPMLLPENAQWLLQDINLLSVYEDVTSAGKIDFLAIYVSDGERKQFIAAFKFKDVEKLFKKESAALWQYPTQANFGNVLHLDIDDGSAYKVAKTLIMNTLSNESQILPDFKQKITDESLSYQWLVRPLEKKINKNEFQPIELEVYNEDTDLKLVAKFDFEKVKSLIQAKENYFLSYTEALKQKLFVSDLQPTMPTPVRKEKTNKLFKKQITSDLNMKEEENKALFQQGREFVKYLVEAVRAKRLKAYLSDSLKTKLQTEEFEANLTILPQMSVADSLVAIPLEMSQLYKLNLIEEMRFDQEGKRKTYQIKVISFLLPAQENTAKGIDEALVYFAYKDIIKMVKKNKLTDILLLFKDRKFKAIPIFTNPSVR